MGDVATVLIDEQELPCSDAPRNRSRHARRRVRAWRGSLGDGDVCVGDSTMSPVTMPPPIASVL